MKLHCEFCKKQYVSKASLWTHQHKTKACLKIQEEIRIKNEIQMQKEKQAEKETTEKYIYFLENELNNVKNKLGSELKAKDARIKELEQQIFEIAKQAKVINNNNNSTTTTNNNIINLQVFDFTPEKIDEYFSHNLTFNDVCGGRLSFAEFVGNMVRGKYICTDAARGVFRYLNMEGDEKLDIRAKMLIDMIEYPVRTHFNRLLIDKDPDYKEYVESQRRELSCLKARPQKFVVELGAVLKD